MISPVIYEPIVCALCHKPASGHRRDNGECYAYERAYTKPLVYRVARPQAATAGWRMR